MARPRRFRLVFLSCALAAGWLAAAPSVAATPTGVSFSEPSHRLPRVYRGSSRSFELGLSGPPRTECTVEASPVQIPSGARAAGVIARLPENRISFDEEGNARLRGEVTTDLRSYLGEASFEVRATTGAREPARARVELLVTQRKLVADEVLDFGDVHFRGTAHATLGLELWSPVAASAWFDWEPLVERSGGEILAAFITPDARSVDLAPDAHVDVGLSVRVPRGARAGEYSGTLAIQAGPHRLSVRMRVNVVTPSLMVTPERVDLGDVYGGADAKLEFAITLTGSVPEAIELALPGPLAKFTRAGARLEPLRVEMKGGVREIDPGRPTTAVASIEIPPAQEDGEYTGELIVRAGAARAIVPVRVNVPRPSSLPAFEVSQLELGLSASSDDEGIGSVALHSNLDQEIAVDARLSTVVPEHWDFFVGDEDASGQTLIVVPPRGSVDVPLHAVLAEGSPPPGASVVSVEFEYDTELVRTDVTLTPVLSTAVPARTRKHVPGRGRAVVIMLMVVSAIVLAAGWRRTPVRYAAASTIFHLFLLTFGLGAPFRGSPGSRPPQEKTFSIQVIQLDDPFGEQIASIAGSAFPKDSAANVGGEANESVSPATVAGAAPPPAAHLARPTAAVPADPDAPARPRARETPEIARTCAPLPGPRRAAPSEGLDDEGPDALISTLEPGTLKRARASGEETFGALATTFRAGAVTRGPVVLVEDIPDDAIAGPELTPDAPRVDAPTRIRTSYSAQVARDIGAAEPGPEAPSLERSSFARAPGAPAETAPHSIPIPEFARREVSERVAAVAAPERAEPAPKPTSVGRTSVAAGSEGRLVTRHTPPPRERPRREVDAPPTRLARSQATVDIPEPTLVRPRHREVTEAVEAKRPTAKPVTNEVGVQTITRARGRTPAGLPGRLEESFARTGPRRLTSSLPGAVLARAGRVPAPSVPASRGTATIGRVRAVSGETMFGVLKHDGEWNVTPRAMGILARELPKRHPGFPMVPRVVPLKPTDDSLFQCAILFVTGRKAPGMTPASAKRVATYLDRGGFIWIDDAASPGDNTFDRSARGWIASLMPGASLRRIPVSHELYSASYDLVNGYARHTPPAGAWARQGELTGLFSQSGRLMGLYTRNGYGRAMEIDPLRADVLTPPRGLTPRECREGALRMAVNVVVHALRASGQAVASGPTDRPDEDPATRYRYRGRPLEVDRAFLAADGWKELKDGAPIYPSGSAGILSLKIGSSEKDVTGVTRSCPPHVTAARAVVMDVTSALLSSAQLAIRLRSTDGTAYESVPLYLRPGANENLRVPLDGVDFRSTKTGWRRYDASLDRSAGFASVSIILYGRDIAGALRVARWRVEGWAPAR